MTPPIPMRQNGHNICNTSRQKVNQCPTCKKEFLESRCWILQNIIQKMKYPCSIIRKVVSLYLLVSSPSPVKPTALTVHSGVRFRLWSPKPPAGEITCDIWGHDLCEHTALAEAGGSRFILTVDCAAPGLFHRALDSYDETFFLVCRVINMDLYCCFLYVGPEARASSNNYCMTIESTDGSAYVTVCLPAKSYFVDLQTLF